jgi:outer membrane protein assembly factor BamB
VNLEDGKLLWSYEIGAAIKTAPAVLRGMILLGADDGCVYAFRGKRAELQKSEVRIQ